MSFFQWLLFIFMPFPNEIRNYVAFYPQIASMSSIPKFSMEILSEQSISQVHGIRLYMFNGNRTKLFFNGYLTRIMPYNWGLYAL